MPDTNQTESGIMLISKRTQAIVLVIIWSIVAVQAYRVLDDLNTTYRLEKRV